MSIQALQKNLVRDEPYAWAVKPDIFFKVKLELFLVNKWAIKKKMIKSSKSNNMSEVELEIGIRRVDSIDKKFQNFNA